MQSTAQQYELTFILGEKTTQEDGVSKTKFVADLIKKLGGSVTKEELWGRRELAYEINRNRTGFYVTLWFDLPGSELKNLERELRFDESFIRFLTTKAYTTAQPGTLYPVAEAEKEKPEKRGREKEEKSTGEEELRRTSTKTEKTEKVAAPVEDEIPEEERLEKLDEALEELLKDQE
jgi:small subunit ribosomal protein S6